MGTLNAILIATGLERCEFDDECDYCDSPEQGSYVRLHHIPEDGTEADFYICGACIMDAIDDYRYMTRDATIARIKSKLTKEEIALLGI